MKLQSAVLTMVAVIGFISAGCPSSTPDEGTGGTGGKSGGSCTTETPCGGSVVGKWDAMSSCIDLSGKLDISLAGLDPTSCNNVIIAGSLNVTGSFVANADGTYTDNTNTKGQAKIELPAGCLRISGTTTTCEGISGPLAGVGFSSVSCVNAASGGGCTCQATIDQTGGIGQLTPDPQKTGNYTTSGNKLTADGLAEYSYCVAGSKLSLMPETTKFTIAGTIVLQNSGSPGTGGATATGGNKATGGSAGGSTGTGGAVATGGSNGTGGRAGQGGGTSSGGAATGGTTTGGASGTRAEGPCDIYAAGNTPCVAAYSTIRALTKEYNGPLYQVRSGSSSMNTGTGGMLKDIGILPDGFADAATQDAFCANTVCTVSLLYDQSGKKNNMKVAPKGRTDGGMYAAMDDFESSATKGKLKVGGHDVYSLYMAAREGYRLTAKGAGMPLNDMPQGIYMLADGTHYGTACCWDFGNVSPDPTKYGVMNTLFLGTGFWGKGAGSGPWFLGDFEGGVWAGGSGASNVVNNMNPSMKVPFAFGILKTKSMWYALRMADLQKATDITTAYDGKSPKGWVNEGGILLGIGGDNSNNSWGTFYEGAIVSGYPTNETELAVMKNVQAAGYGK